MLRATLGSVGGSALSQLAHHSIFPLKDTLMTKLDVCQCFKLTSVNSEEDLMVSIGEGSRSNQ